MMKSENIANLIEQWFYSADRLFKIDLTTNSYVIGAFIKADDYDELKSKNIWRVIKSSDLIKWKSSHNLELTELINGDLINDISFV